jgi:hypothetical protein
MNLVMFVDFSSKNSSEYFFLMNLYYFQFIEFLSLIFINFVFSVNVEIFQKSSMNIFLK